MSDVVKSVADDGKLSGSNGYGAGWKNVPVMNQASKTRK